METNNPDPLNNQSTQPQREKKPGNIKFYGLAFLGAVIAVGALWLLNPYLRPNKDQKQGQPNSAVVSDYKESDTALKNIPNYEAIKQKYGLNLSPGQEKFLDENQFLLIKQQDTNLNPTLNFDQMLSDFDLIGGSPSIEARRPEDTKLVTPDIMLHSYHKFFEMTLEQLEQHELAQNLNGFLTALQANLLRAEKQSSGDTQTRYQNLLAQITVARVVFENKNGPKPDSFESPDKEALYNEKDKTIDNIDNTKKILAKYSAGLTPDLISKIQTELAGIYKADTVGVSPLFGQYSDSLQTDYTQFTPRSHYTKNSALRAYFRTMMYLGRSSYFFQKDVGITDANLLAKQFAAKSPDGSTPLDYWQKIMSVTAFYAGQSDDLTYTEWKNFETKILGAVSANTDLTSQTNVNKMANNLNQLRLPKILSDVIVDDSVSSQTKNDLLRKSLAFRIFGQRFTFDAWILNDLTAGDEKTEVKLPSTPSALFVSAAMGDAEAQKHAIEFLQKDTGFSQSQADAFLGPLSQKKSDINKISSDDWFHSMGSAWLYVLGSLTHSYGSGYPLYMQAAPFLDKQIQTFLGSYTELKHDTLLYAKQSYAEKGGGGGDETPPPVVKGFVEPNLDFWTRFNQLLNKTQDTFTANKIFQDSAVMARLKNFQDISNFYEGLAKQEMANQAISDDDYEKLRTTALSFMVQPFESATEPDMDSGKVALIADIHTDGVKGQILYEADGVPYLMLAIVGNENSPRVVASLVYNHYEFTGPLSGQRYSDEDWQNWVYDQTEKLPAKNFWYDSLSAK